MSAREVLARGSRSFGFAARFLPADQWDDAALVYAFCRRVDDVADDESASPVSRIRALVRIREEIDGTADPSPEVAGLLDVAGRRGLDLDAARELIRGCASDVGGVRVDDDQQLVRYAYRVASTVGLMMCAVLGVRDRAARPHAIDLGVAMQLTNICRDVAEDAELGRVYLPATRLRAGRERAVAGLLDLAERYYESAWDGLHHLPWRPRLAILIAGRIYRRIGVRLRRRGYDTSTRTVVPLWGKLVEAGRALFLALSPRTLGWTAHPHDPSLHAPLSGLPGTEPIAWPTRSRPSPT